jgi:hypothetical protein
MGAADLEGPLKDFYDRTAQIRRVISLVEAGSRKPKALKTNRPGVDLSLINLTTANTANSMSIVFLASSFEEFFREEISQCGIYFADRYAKLEDDAKHHARNSYWTLCVERIRNVRGILTNDKPRLVDAISISKVKSIVESAKGFVVSDDASYIDGRLFGHHQNNFKPVVVNEIAARLGVKNMIGQISESGKIKSYFGVSTKSECEKRITSRLNSFYDTRNSIVHSLNNSTGYGVDIVLDHIEVFEYTAEAIKSALTSHISKW